MYVARRWRVFVFFWLNLSIFFAWQNAEFRDATRLLYKDTRWKMSLLHQVMLHFNLFHMDWKCQCQSQIPPWWHRVASGINTGNSNCYICKISAGARELLNCVYVSRRWGIIRRDGVWDEFHAWLNNLLPTAHLRFIRLDRDWTSLDVGGLPSELLLLPSSLDFYAHLNTLLEVWNIK